MNENNELKECARCKEKKSLDRFKKNRNICKDCYNKKDSLIKFQHKEFANQNSDLTKKCSICSEYKSLKKFSGNCSTCNRCIYLRNSLKNPELYMFQRIKNRSKRENLSFNLELSDISIPNFCPVLGIKLERGNSKAYDNSPSIDRIDNTKGYIKGNTKIISNRANVLKGSGNADEHEKIVIYIQENTVRDYQI